MNVLLVLNNDESQLKFQNLPEKSYSVTMCRGFVEAFNLIRSLDLDLVLSNYQLHDGTAFELFSEVKKLAPKMRCVLYCTSNEVIAHSASILASGLVDHVLTDSCHKHQIAEALDDFHKLQILNTTETGLKNDPVPFKRLKAN